MTDAGVDPASVAPDASVGPDGPDAPVDLLVRDAELVATVDAARTELRGGWVGIREGLIVAVGDAATPAPPARRELDARGCLVTPGLINTHHHIYQNLTRAFRPAVNGTLFHWLTDAISPLGAASTRRRAYLSAWIGLAELALGGCTTSTDHLYVHPRGAGDLIAAEIRAAAELGHAFPPDPRFDESVAEGRRPPARFGRAGRRRDPRRQRAARAGAPRSAPGARWCASRWRRARPSR